jgi:hypothetical protein
MLLYWMNKFRELEGTLLACLDQLSVGAQVGLEPCVAVEDVEASQFQLCQR